MFSENRCENNQILFSILDSTKLVFNVSWLPEVWDLVSLKFRLITNLYKYKTDFQKAPKPTFWETAVTRSLFFFVQCFSFTFTYYFWFLFGLFSLFFSNYTLPLSKSLLPSWNILLPLVKFLSPTIIFLKPTKTFLLPNKYFLLP